MARVLPDAEIAALVAEEKRMQGYGIPNFVNRTLYRMDNLDALRGINSGTIDLIATDPPFNKGRDFHATPDSLAAGASFEDRWRWEEDVHQDWIDEIADGWPTVNALINAVKEADTEMAAFMCFMAARLIEMKRVLKDTGSIYVHLDPTASHYIKGLMDTIFGRANFRNEIIWAYTGPSNTTRWFPRKHDCILFYVKGTGAAFNRDAVRVPYKMIGIGKGDSIFHEGDNRERVEELLRIGKVPSDWWADDHLTNISAWKRERTGYPTQKPLALYERIIKASSSEGDVVLDPFAGCATTCVAAERLGRQWIGADYWKETPELIVTRLADALPVPLQVSGWREAVTVTMEGPERTDGEESIVPTFITPTGERRRRTRWTRDEMMKMLIGAFGARCWACAFDYDDPEHYELDHIRPHSEGGSDELHNRAVTCGPCNRRKSNRHTLTWAREQKGYGRGMAHPIDLRKAALWAEEQERLFDAGRE